MSHHVKPRVRKVRSGYWACEFVEPWKYRAFGTWWEALTHARYLFERMYRFV